MSRALIIGIASLLAVALIAPAAQAASQIRHFQTDLAPVGAPPQQNGGQIGLDIVFKNKRGNPRKFTPRQLTVVDILNMPITCTNSPGDPSTSTTLTSTIQTQAKLKKAPNPSGAKPKARRYSFKLATNFTEFTGTLRGKVFKRDGRGKVIANGVLNIDRLDFPGGPTNCATMGGRGWSAP
jgi:hypothetical protein